VTAASSLTVLGEPGEPLDPVQELWRMDNQARRDAVQDQPTND
jgi:hypothetical protein